MALVRMCKSAGSFEGEDDATTEVELIHEVLKVIAPNVHTHDKAIAQIRKLYSKFFRDPQDLADLLFLPADRRSQKNEHQNHRLTQRLSATEAISEAEFRALAESLQSSSHIDDKILLVMLCTGRRFIEVVKVTAIPESESKDGWWIADRQCKSGGLCTPREFPFILLPFDSLKKIWLEVRQYMKDKGFDELTNVEISNKMGKRISTRTKKLSPIFELGHRMGSHTMRKLYGVHSHSERAHGRMEKVLWINKVLGHKENDYRSAMHYRNVRIEPDSKKIAGL